MALFHGNWFLMIMDTEQVNSELNHAGSTPKLIKSKGIKSIKGKVRKLTTIDLNEVARLVATRKMTETDACIMLDIKPSRWFDFKSRNRHSTEFSDAIIRMRENKICGMVDLIEDSANGIGIKQRDWRAGAWIAERLAPERFAQVKSDAPAVTNNLNVVVMSDTLKRIYSNELEKPIHQLSEPARVCKPVRS